MICERKETAMLGEAKHPCVFKTQRPLKFLVVYTF